MSKTVDDWDGQLVVREARGKYARAVRAAGSAGRAWAGTTAPVGVKASALARAAAASLPVSEDGFKIRDCALPPDTADQAFLPSSELRRYAAQTAREITVRNPPFSS